MAPGIDAHICRIPTPPHFDSRPRRQIPPALWATGGFGFCANIQLLHPILTVLEEGFSPPPPSSPGLWTVVSRGGRSHLYPTFSSSWSSSFFHHFSNTILYRCLLDFAPQLGAKIHQKSIKNRSQERSGKLPTFCIDFS